MVHADGLVAAADEAVGHHREQRVLEVSVRKRRGIDPFLVGANPRNVCEGVDGESVGSQFEDTVQRFGIRRLGLTRQAVDQVHVDGCVAQVSSSQMEALRLLPCLMTTDQVLHLRVEVLHSE